MCKEMIETWYVFGYTFIDTTIYIDIQVILVLVLVAGLDSKWGLPVLDLKFCTCVLYYRLISLFQ